MKVLFQIVLHTGAILALLGAANAQTQSEPSPLTLEQAVQIAMEQNPQRKAALADSRGASADLGTARSFLLPRLTFSEAATRGNDPVYVFGSKLRQQRFTASDFALSQLNTPAPYDNFSTRLGLTWSLFDSFASWHNLRRAKDMTDAANRQVDRTAQEIVFRAVTTYYNLLLAAKQAEVAEESVKTAQAITERSQSRFDSGLVVESDLLTAKVRLAQRKMELIRASNDLELARTQLNVALGVPVDSSFQLSDVLAERAIPLPELAEAEKQTLANRPDLKRIAAEESAQRESVAAAKSSFGPRVNGFADWELDNPTFVSGGGNNWLAGVELQVDIYQGGAKRAELSRQRALHQKMIAIRQAATDGIRLDVRRAYYEVNASRQQIEVARATMAHALESLRINRDRYESGVITITDLLSAEDDNRHSQTSYWEAVYRLHASHANLELAEGTLNPQSPVVMP